MSEVPFSDLKAQYRSIRREIEAAIQGVVESQRFIGGSVLEQFERSFAEATEARYAVGVSNGTAALSLALEAAGIREGDEVILPSLTFAATAEAVCHVGAVPVFVDSDPDTMTMSVQSAEAHINARTRCVIPVHIYGNPCDMNAIVALAMVHDLIVVEDAAQAHLARYDDRPIGSFGDVATYSFFPGKNLGAYGDAGAITTDNGDLSDRVRQLRDHGRSGKYVHEVIGYNHRMDAVQAAVLSVKLRYLASWTDARRGIARKYDDAFSAADLQILSTASGADASYHLYPIRVEHRDSVLEMITSAGVGVGLHYPIPLHDQPAFAGFVKPDSDLATSERIARSEISLPIYPEMTDGQVDQVIEVVLAATARVHG